MDIWSILLIVAGLCAFEIISSIDNAIIDAEILSTMGARARRWFLIWGFLFAVLAIRGLLPWLIVWMVVPDLGPIGAWTATFSNDPRIESAIEQASPILLMGGGIFLLFLFLHWLFLEPKHYGLPGEKFFHRQGAWFYALVSIILVVVVWFSLQENTMLAFSAVIGSSVFFITHGFKQYAEQQEARLMDKTSGISDISKLMYLEVIDGTFSIDGVVGAFAFTLSVPLILFGNGLGALVLRYFTFTNIQRIKRYKYLKNGAMYSIVILGIIMIADGFHIHIPHWLAPVSTFVIVGYFYWQSRAALQKEDLAAGQ